MVSPAYSHAVSLFTVTLFCHTWLRTRDREGIERYVLLGALGGLVALARWQDVIVLSLPLFELCLAVARRERSVVSATGRMATLGLALLLVFIPQMAAWQVIYGEFLLTPQGGGFMNWTDPAIGSVLLSLNHGLFTWTPALALAMIGFRRLIQRDAVVGWSALAILAQAVYINAAVSDWWAGEAFGARRFIGYTVLFALGLAAFFSGRFWTARLTLLRWSATGLVVYNMLFLLQYQLFMRGLDELAPYPTTAREVFLDRLAIPWRLVRHWLG